MLKYLAKRTVLAVFIMFCSAFLTFALICIMPGEAYSRMKIAIAAGGRDKLEATYNELLKSAGLDRPWIVQFFAWIKGVIVDGSFGRPVYGAYHRDHGGDDALTLRYLFRAGGELPISLVICVTSVVIGLALAVVFGALTLLPKLRWLYGLLTAISAPTVAIPGFVLAGLLLLFLVHFVDPLHAVPGLWGVCGWQYVGEPMSWAKFLGCLARLTPVWFIVGMPVFATGLRVFRAAMKDQLGMLYVTVARGRGLPMRRVLLKHVSRNALNPLISVAADVLPTVLVNTMLVGFMFGIPTYGDLLRTAVDWQDPAPLATLMVFYSFVLVVGTLIADIGLALADPRIRYT